MFFHKTRTLSPINTLFIISLEKVWMVLSSLMHVFWLYTATLSFISVGSSVREELHLQDMGRQTQ